MFRRLIGEDINLAWIPGERIWPVKIDPSQVDQILANLCVNARDAIPGIGKKTLSHLRMLQKMSQRVANYFRYPKIAYAA
ncbi:MAG: hypothetical protein AB1Z16_08235 [Desulfotignum sp.]